MSLVFCVAGLSAAVKKTHTCESTVSSSVSSAVCWMLSRKLPPGLVKLTLEKLFGLMGVLLLSLKLLVYESVTVKKFSLRKKAVSFTLGKYLIVQEKKELRSVHEQAEMFGDIQPIILNLALKMI